MPHRNQDNDKLDQVLQLLIEAASENKVGFNHYVSQIIDKLKKTELKASEKVKETASVVDRHLHTKPWIYVAAATLSGIAIGYLLPRPKFHK